MISRAGLLAAGGLVASGALILDRVALRMIKPPHKPLRRRAFDLPFRCREHPFWSNGQRLMGWALEPDSKNRAPVLILIHGWGSNHGTMTRLAEPALDRGYPVFLFDVRHHGESRDASYVTARHFRDDIMSAVSEVQAHFPGRPRVLVGHSMGGSTAVLAAAASRRPAPETPGVDGLVTIAAPGDLWKVWAYHFDRRGLPGTWVVRGLRPFWRRRAGVSFSHLDPLLRARDVEAPALVLHGTADESVSVDHAFLLARALGVRPDILEGLGHSDLLENPVLHERLFGFLEDRFPGRRPSRRPTRSERAG